MQTPEDKHKRMYPMAKGGSASKREGKRKQKQIKKALDGARKKCQRVFSVKVANSCSYGDNVVEPHVLNKDVISKLGQHDVKWLKLLFEKNLFTKEVT